MQSDKKKPGFFFGSGKTEADLTPRDQIIAACVEEAIIEFLSHLVPCDYEFELHIESSHNEQCANGVKMIRGEDWEGALQAFQAALAEDSQDDRAAFGAGVVCEKLGKYEEALKYFRNACVIQDELEYAEARDRVKRFIGRAAGASG